MSSAEAEDGVMADRWMDERDREWRERDWRRSENFGRGGVRTWGEDRSWSGPADDDRGPHEDRDWTRAYGEGSEDYRARSGLTYGGASGGYSEGRGGGRGQAYRSGPGQAYGRGGAAPRFADQDYTRADPDEAGWADRVYETRYGAEDEAYYGAAWDPTDDRAYNAQRRRGGRQGPERSHSDDELERRYYEGGYRDARRADPRRGEWAERRDEGRRREGREGRMGEAGDFLSRAGERISSWFRGGRDEERDDVRGYREDYGRDARYADDRGHRGVGPKGYQRSDERINEEVHDRLTDDPWLDASNIEVAVKGGEVTLSGTVDNREAKHRAERLIEDLSGVSHVQNNLRVNPNATFTGAGRGFGSSALEEEMRRNAAATDPNNNGVSGLSGRTSTGAAAERSTPDKR
jgi:hypothetical protein